MRSRHSKAKKDINGNALKGRPSFDHNTPKAKGLIDSEIKELKYGELVGSFERKKLPELFQEIEEPIEALKAYIKHLILALTPRDIVVIHSKRACKNKDIINALYDQIMIEMTFDFRSQDKNQLEGYFRNILESGMHMAISKGDLKSFFAGAKLMKDLFGIESRKVVRTEIAGKTIQDIFGKEFTAICSSIQEEENSEEE